MDNFTRLVERAHKLILEAGEVPPPPAPTGGGAPTGSPPAGGAPEMPAPGGGAPSGGMGGDAAGGGEAADQELDNKTKKDADPLAYTESILKMLVDETEGISPEMFNSFIDNVGLAATKVKDKEGFKKFYGSFYAKLQAVMDVKEELKDMFQQLKSNVEDLMSEPDNTPDNAGGGKGMAKPAGPGVK